LIRRILQAFSTLLPARILAIGEPIIENLKPNDDLVMTKKNCLISIEDIDILSISCKCINILSISSKGIDICQKSVFSFTLFFLFGTVISIPLDDISKISILLVDIDKILIPLDDIEILFLSFESFLSPFKISMKDILIFMLKKNYAQITKIDLDFSGQKSKTSHFDSLVLLFKFNR
ncbi:hypothetical protein BpHYR1_017500, partial [Brachionus plicatilis]